MDDVKQPIVTKKILVDHSHPHGSWKLAFGGMALAMMAFFMVLWLVGQTDGDQRGGIAEFFHNPTMIQGLSQAPTGAVGPGGASRGLIALGSTFERAKAQTSYIQSTVDRKKKLVEKLKLLAEIKRLDAILKKLQEALMKSSTLRPYKDQFIMNISPEGLRIQIIDGKDRPMFDSGSARLKPYTAEILYVIARNIRDSPNHISITGHTDSSPYTGRRNYSNWELSVDRANAARRALLKGGLQGNRVGRVVGLADSIPYNPTDPLSPSNRRINIVIMNQSAYEALAEGEAPPQKTTHALATDGTGEKGPNVNYDPGKSTYKNIGVEKIPSVDPLNLDLQTTFEETSEKTPNVMYDPGKSTYGNIKVEEIPVADPLILEQQKPSRESGLFAEEPKSESAPENTGSQNKDTRPVKNKVYRSGSMVNKPSLDKPSLDEPSFDLPPIIDPSLVPGSTVEE